MIALLYCLISMHLTTMCVTLYLHRGQTHKSLIFSVYLEHFMRFWLWLTTGIVTKEWVAVHRYHHQKTDLKEDPHSPVHYGIYTVIFKGTFLYRAATKDKNFVNNYGKGTSEDFIENFVYTPYNMVGILLLLLFNMTFFGAVGLIIWIFQMIWIPFSAAGIINGLGHWCGYRNYDTDDKSFNISRFGILICGEELHNNHHKDPANPKLSHTKGEFDMGWFWIKTFQRLNLLIIR